jgi:HEAT repeat protein
MLYFSNPSSAEHNRIDSQASGNSHFFAIQIGAFSKSDTAGSIVQNLSKKGIHCDIHKSRTLFKVYCGSTGTKLEATRLKGEVAKVGYKDAYLVSLQKPIRGISAKKEPLSDSTTKDEQRSAETRKPSTGSVQAKSDVSTAKLNKSPAALETKNSMRPRGKPAPPQAEPETTRNKQAKDKIPSTYVSIPPSLIEGRISAERQIVDEAKGNSFVGNGTIKNRHSGLSFSNSLRKGKGIILYIILFVSLVIITFLIWVIVLKKKGEVRTLKTGKLLRRHKELVQQLSEEQPDSFDAIIAKLKKIDNSMLVELLLDKAAFLSGKAVQNFRHFYDAIGITDHYIELLKDSKSWKKRAFAAEKIGHIGSAKPVPYLIEIIRDINNEDEDVRTVALRALGRIKDERAIPFLIEALGYPETWLPPRIGEILVNIGEPTIDYLKKELKNFQSESRRGWSAEILGWLDAKNAETSLIEALFDVNPEVRAKAAGALGKIKSDRSIVKLTELLVAEPVPYVRTRVSQALGAIGNPSVIHYLVNILKDPEWWVRVRAVEALEQLGKESTPSLLIALEDEDPEVRRRSALALERIGYVEQILQEYGEDQYKPELRKILFLIAQAGVIESLSDKLSKADKNLQKRIVRLLGEAETADAADPLIDLLKNTEDWTLQARIIQSIGKVDAQKAIPTLIHYLRDNEYWVRRSAVEALAMLNAVNYVDDVAAILKDPNPQARESALRALSMLKVTSHWDKIENLLYDPATKVRSTALMVMRELGITVDQKKIVEILIEASDDVRIEAIKYFTAIMDADVLNEIIKLIPFGSTQLHREITEYIRKVKPEGFHTLTDMVNLKDLENDALTTFIEIASIIKDDDAYNFVLEFTDSVDEVLREKAFRAMAAFGFSENEALFEKAIFDPSRSVRTIVLACVGSKTNDAFLKKAQVLLKDPDENVRLALTLAFGVSGIKEFKSLIMKMLDDPSNRVVAGAFISLASFNDPKFLKVFYSHPNIKDIKAEITNISDDDRFRHIIEEIRLKAEKTRNMEVDLIFAKNDRVFANELVKKLREALDPVLRIQAIEMLKIIATPELFTSILSVTKKDPFAEVRLQAMDVVASIGREDEVISAFASSLFDPAPQVRDKAAELLGKYRNPRALEALLHVLDTPDKEFREAVTTALSYLLRGDPDKNAELLKNMPETKTRKIGMAWLMGKSRRKGSVKFLTGLLDDVDPEVRAAAVGAIAKFKKIQFINSLEKLIYDPNERVRAAAVNAITITGGERAFDIASVALQDIDNFVRTRTVIGLAKLNIRKTIRVIRSKVTKFPELRSHLKAVLYAAGQHYEDIENMDSVAVNIVDELCHKGEMKSIFMQSTDREKRMHALRVLALISNGDNYEFLSQALKDPVSEIREEAKKYSGVM